MNTGTSSDFEHEDSVSDGEAGSGDIYDYCGESAYPNSRSYYPLLVPIKCIARRH